MATGGRHSYADTLKNLQNGLSIDLSNFKSVHVERDTARLIIGGGVRGSDITDADSEAGMELCKCTLIERYILVNKTFQLLIIAPVLKLWELPLALG